MRDYYQLMDTDHESCGIVLTEVDEDTVTGLWKKFYGEADDLDIDVFIETQLIPIDAKAERIFLNIVSI